MAADYFLKIDGVEGESTDDKHKSEIDIESFSFGASNAGSATHGGGGGAGKVSMQDFHFTMKYDKASPVLFLACATGEHIKKAVLTCRKAGGEQQEYLKVTFSDLLVSSYAAAGSDPPEDTPTPDEGGVEVQAASSSVPTSAIAFNFSKIEWDYTTFNADGRAGEIVHVGWDLKKNEKV